MSDKTPLVKKQDDEEVAYNTANLYDWRKATDGLEESDARNENFFNSLRLFCCPKLGIF
jgi:membrane associated rhomboid family serine protease